MDTNQDGVFELMAIEAIKNYLNTDLTNDEIRSKYYLAVMHVSDNVENIVTRDGSITSMTESSRNVAFNNNYSIIDNTAKMLLPKPCIKLF